MIRILGIDCSSTTIGYCVLELNETNNITLVKTAYLKPTKKGSILDRLIDTRNAINKIIEETKPDYIGIEDIISFMAGKSTAKTIITLTAFNRMIGLAAYDYLGKTPMLFSVMTIRHALKPTKLLPKKKDMAEVVAKHLGITFPYVINKKGKVIIENEDMADAIAVALYYAFVLTGRVKKK